MPEELRPRIIFDDSPRTGDEPVYDWLASRGWCWGIQCKPEVSEASLRALRARGFEAGILLPAHPETRDRQWGGWKQPIPDPEAVIGRAIAAAGGRAEEVVWEVLVEEDSAGVSHPQRILSARPRTHRDAYELLAGRVAEAMAVARPMRDRGVRIWGLCGFASTAHVYAAARAECVIAERANDDVDDLQTGIAFCRGAARQYAIDWGIDLSYWWGPIYGSVAPLPPSYHRRNAFMVCFSGADVLRIEGSGPCWDDRRAEPTEFGAMLDEVGTLAREAGTGEPDTPVAVVLPRDHGWISPPAWRATREAWNYARIPYRMADRGVDGLFAAAFPGSEIAMHPFPFGKYESDDPPASPFALSCVTPRYAVRPEDVFYADPPIPFGRFRDRKAAGETLLRERPDSSPYRPMGDSRWGDVFDVLTAEAPAEALARYPVAVLAGGIVLSDDVVARLAAYARAGGTLVLPSGIATPEHAAFAGVEITPELVAERGWRWGREPVEAESFLYTPLRAVGKGATVLATGIEGSPLVVRRKTGDGAVLTCALPWYSSGPNALSGLALRLLDRVVGAVQPVEVRGLPVQWVSSRGDGHVTVALANHGGVPWKGEVFARSVPVRLGRCRELTTGKRLSAERSRRGARAKVTVPAYGVRILRFER